METARKYVLVEPTKYEQLIELERKKSNVPPDNFTNPTELPQKDTSIFAHPNVERVYELDNEMKEILNNQSMTDFDKAMQYGQRLQSYLGNFKTALTTPKNSALIGEKLEENHNAIIENKNSATTSTGNEILSAIPKSYQSKAAHLLNFLKTNSNISWTDDGTVKYKNDVLPNSNVVNLVGDLIRLRKPQSEANTVAHFRNALEAEGYPLNRLAISKRNINRLKGRNYSGTIKKKNISKPKGRKSSVVKERPTLKSKIPISEREKSRLLSRWESSL